VLGFFEGANFQDKVFGNLKLQKVNLRAHVRGIGVCPDGRVYTYVRAHFLEISTLGKFDKLNSGKKFQKFKFPKTLNSGKTFSKKNSIKFFKILEIQIPETFPESYSLEKSQRV